MFEGIQFIGYEGAYDSGHSWLGQGLPGTWKDYDLTATKSADFRVAGRVESVLTTPVPAEKACSLAYLQSFSHMDVDEAYFTLRRGYQSYLLLYTYDGNGSLRYRGKAYDLGPGDAFLIDCVDEHEYRTVGSRWHHADLHFYGGPARLFYTEYLAAHRPVFHCPNPERLQGSLEDILASNQSAAIDRGFRTSFELQRLLFSLKSWMEAAEGALVTPGPIQTLRAYLDRHYVEHMSLDEMARVAGLSKYHLIRQFKRIVGATPKEYVIALRVRQAQQLLAATDIPCYRIGLLVGFRSEAGFIRHFKLATGETPQGHRNRCRQSPFERTDG